MIVFKWIGNVVKRLLLMSFLPFHNHHHHLSNRWTVTPISHLTAKHHHTIISPQQSLPHHHHVVASQRRRFICAIGWCLTLVCVPNGRILAAASIGKSKSSVGSKCPCSWAWGGWPPSLTPRSIRHSSQESAQWRDVATGGVGGTVFGGGSGAAGQKWQHDGWVGGRKVKTEEGNRKCRGTIIHPSLCNWCVMYPIL